MSDNTHVLADEPEAMRSAVSVARFAPSLHNTQPWQWRITAGSMDLYTDHRRHMRLTDPQGRLMVFSCGAALRYAHIALQIQGYTEPAVHRPQHDRVDAGDVLLARLTPAGRREPNPRSIHALRLMMLRRTDRGPVSAEAVPPEVLDRLGATCEENGAYLQLLNDDQVTRLSAITGQAQRLSEAEPHRLAELDEWSSGHQREGIGVPGHNVNTEPGRVRVAPRRFGLARPLPPANPTGRTPGDAAATYAILHVPVDTPAAWLRAGEALVATWLDATGANVAVQPFSETIEVDASRVRLTELLGGIGYPMLVLRFGRAAPQDSIPPATPRLSISDVLREATA